MLPAGTLHTWLETEHVSDCSILPPTQNILTTTRSTVMFPETTCVQTVCKGDKKGTGLAYML